MPIAFITSKMVCVPARIIGDFQWLVSQYVQIKLFG
jgi:hypothetical protein